MIHLNQRLKVQYAGGKQEMGSYFVTKARHNFPNIITAVDDVAQSWRMTATTASSWQQAGLESWEGL